MGVFAALNGTRTWPTAILRAMTISLISITKVDGIFDMK